MDGTRGTEDRAPRWDRWRLPEFRRPAGAVAATALLAALLISLSLSLFLPAGTSIHSTLTLMRYNNGAAPVTARTKGCGSYSDTRHIGHVMQATIRLAAGFCWNGKTVWWTWGLTRGSCYPAGTFFTQVHMTCQITGGGRAPITVRYEAQVSSSFFPFMTRTETLDLIVTPEGYRLQIPFEPS